MLEKMKKSRLSAVSVLALTLTWGGSALASAYEGHQLQGMSSDGTVYLEYSQGTSKGSSAAADLTVRLVSTITGGITTIPIPSTASAGSAILSADGKTVVGTYYNDADNKQYSYRWTAGGGFVTFGTPEEANVVAVSETGVSAGYYYDSETESYVAAIWDADGRTDAPTDTRFVATRANNISRDASTVVGSLYVTDDDANTHAMVWNRENNTIRDIHTSTYVASTATHVSADGSVVAGHGGDANGKIRVFRWTSDNETMQDIGSLVEDGYMELTAMSDDGDVLVGNGLSENTYAHAYRYVASASADNPEDLGTLGGFASRASDVSADGKYIVGQSMDADGEWYGFRWSEETNMQSIEDWLADAGVTVDYATQTAEYISNDGKIVIGKTDDNDVYVARSEGIIKEEEFYPTLVQVGSSTVQNSVSSANTIMFGAQGNPMRNLMGVGERSVWGTVDGGYDNSDISKGGLALGEFGYGYGLADGITARFSVGGSYSKQDLDAGGFVKQTGYYLSPEVSANVASDLYVTVGGYFSRTNIDTSRGYLNGSTQDYSNGSTGADTWGGKIRFDWLNAANLANTDITPYAGLSYARTTVDAYTETGGAFPVRYDETSDHSTIARLGADFVRPMNDTVRLLAKTEVSYQFEDQSAATSGTLTGISDFNVDGHELKQFWVRGGIGAEFDVGGGTASFMVNATTQGQDPTVWLRSNYTVKF